MEIWPYENLCSFTILAPKVVEDNVASTRSLLGLCSFKDGDYSSEFARAEQKMRIEKSTDKSFSFSFHFEFNVTLSLKDTVCLA